MNHLTQLYNRTHRSTYHEPLMVSRNRGSNSLGFSYVPVHALLHGCNVTKHLFTRAFYIQLHSAIRKIRYFACHFKFTRNLKGGIAKAYALNMP
jgi:hypothetical protein